MLIFPALGINFHSTRRLRFSTPLSFALAFIPMGGWQHHLATLHHDAVHYLLFRNRKLNEWVARFFLGYPVGLTMGYRRIHLAHHRHLGERGDPDLPNYVGFPARLAKLLTALARNLLGVSVWSQIRKERTNDAPFEMAGQASLNRHYS
ncbi:MAG: fatty acid desaturase [Candidatus Marinimicrobia bacterium]|nr:fatty acid desaturase [Candidatus Neomarinimicrobiota bacterium]